MGMIIITFKSKPNRAFSYNGTVEEFKREMIKAQVSNQEVFEYDSTLINWTDISTVKPYC